MLKKAAFPGKYLQGAGALYELPALVQSFGQRGLIRQTFGPWRDYFKADFHPSHHDPAASLRWLEDNRARYQPVRT